jgi:hypothetical protein
MSNIAHKAAIQYIFFYRKEKQHSLIKGESKQSQLLLTRFSKTCEVAYLETFEKSLIC